MRIHVYRFGLMLAVTIAVGAGCGPERPAEIADSSPAQSPVDNRETPDAGADDETVGDIPESESVRRLHARELAAGRSLGDALAALPDADEATAVRTLQRFAILPATQVTERLVRSTAEFLEIESLQLRAVATRTLGTFGAKASSAVPRPARRFGGPRAGRRDDRSVGSNRPIRRRGDRGFGSLRRIGHASYFHSPASDPSAHPHRPRFSVDAENTERCARGPRSEDPPDGRRALSNRCGRRVKARCDRVFPGRNWRWRLAASTIGDVEGIRDDRSRRDATRVPARIGAR